ncbi:hypothetical protein DER46DRAFT_59385 [Fusarium sp. MPI-SDFR-AT-0072]|nr:hypothetical protein DER46DRAFT_59385 [Fusarium sp. MPI-SDFR-AT-0072]
MNIIKEYILMVLLASLFMCNPIDNEMKNASTFSSCSRLYLSMAGSHESCHIWPLAVDLAAALRLNIQNTVVISMSK